MQNNGGRAPLPGDADTILSGAGNLGQYELSTTGPGANFSVAGYSTAVGKVDSAEKITVVTGAICSTTDTGKPAVGSKRQIAILWASETTSSTPIPGCTEF